VSPAVPAPRPPAVDPDTFRATLGRFASGVTVLTAVDAAGRDHGMTVSAFCSLSLDPPLVLACVDRQASMHDVLAEGTPFVVNVLAAGQEALSRRFATGDPGDRFAGVGYGRAGGGAALLDGVLAWLDCRVAARLPGGDHSVVVGAVHEAGTNDAARPLLYYRSGYASLER
jgi:flavin reductase (DIM6/NTAB) family NADH-FMN oxidoreductase RutF